MEIRLIWAQVESHLITPLFKPTKRFSPQNANQNDHASLKFLNNHVSLFLCHITFVPYFLSLIPTHCFSNTRLLIFFWIYQEGLFSAQASLGILYKLLLHFLSTLFFCYLSVLLSLIALSFPISTFLCSDNYP